MTDKELGVSESRVPKRVVCLRVWVSAAFLVCWSPWLGVVARAESDKLIDSLMYRDPDLTFSGEVVKFPEGARALWLRALERPDAEMKCRAAQAIVEAHHRGVKGMETTIRPLLVECDKENQPLAVRLAVARALVELDAREATTILFRQAQTGDGDLRDTIEPALARWDYRPARQIWLERLREPTTPHRSLILAIRGLAAVGEKEAIDRLLEIVLDKQVRGPIRIEAARGLGRLRPEGLHKDAEQLAADPSPRGIVARLAAASLLRYHRSSESIQLMQKLALANEPSVAVIAIARLFEIDPELLVPEIEKHLGKPDAAIRSFAVDVLRRRSTEKHLHLLSDRLDDEHLGVRRKARGYLLELAKEEKWHKQVIADAITMLKKESWRGQEQAALLLTQLDQKQAAGRLVQLLRSKRSEVKLTAAWALRKLDVPETLPDVVRYIEDAINVKASGQPAAAVFPYEEHFIRETPDHTVSQLNQFLGQRKYRPAVDLLHRFVPRGSFSQEARAAAIWALGKILAEKPEETIVMDLEGRLNDLGPPPEDFRVRWMCAVSLARMKAKDTLPSLQRYCNSGLKPSRDPFTNACSWAVSQLTGKKMPPPENTIRYQIDWFLVPDK
jgi:HEAT repeat protein